ncbi:hypothetical protein EDD22DRAFT_915060, partial [Suillus occidentalis]
PRATPFHHNLSIHGIGVPLCFLTLHAKSLGELSEPGAPLDGSSSEQEQDDWELSEQALQLLIRLGLPFGTFLLAQQLRGGEYRRIASDHDIIAHVKDIDSVYN